jgi:hypothetical protein
VGCVEGEMCGVDGTGEVITFEESIDIKEDISIKVEEAMDIKNETPQVPLIKTEHEVRLWDVCV